MLWRHQLPVRVCNHIRARTEFFFYPVPGSGSGRVPGTRLRVESSTGYPAGLQDTNLKFIKVKNPINSSYLEFIKINNQQTNKTKIFIWYLLLIIQ